MTMPSVPPRRRGAVRFALAAGVLLAVNGLAGCNLTDVSDPTKVEEESVSNSTGADLMRRRALYSLDQAEAGEVWYAGLLADEFRITPYNPSNYLAQVNRRFPDQTRIEEGFSRVNAFYKLRHETRYQATMALRQLAAYAPESRRAAHVGQMYAVRGYSTTRLGEDFCAGFPLHELDGFTPVYGPPLTSPQVFERALADLDSAMPLVADSARIANFARVVRGRTLLDLGRAADAAAAVADVPTGYVLDNEGGGNVLDFGNEYLGESVADGEGTVGLDFVSANDPRLPTTFVATAALDGVTRLYRADKFADYLTPTVLASGIEARLIEAEGALAAGQPQWLTKLNELRTTCTDAGTCPDPAPAGTGNVAGLPPLSDPGTDNARLDLVFRERAFWLFGTGHRLADLRRLVHNYERSSDTVFPSGGDYDGGAMSLPFPYPETEKTFSPGVEWCTSP